MAQQGTAPNFFFLGAASPRKPSLTLALVRALWVVFTGWVVSVPLQPEVPGRQIQV